MRKVLAEAKRIVVKVGSSTLTHSSGQLNLRKIENLVKQLSDLSNRNREIILVTSGAVAAGLPALHLREKPQDLALRQAAAAVGQGVLLHMYEKFFREYGKTVGQVLLTREDTVKKSHYVNVRNTLFSLLKLGVIPIVNENDVVAVDEFKIGDNDTLSANVASLIEADLLIILSDIDGLYTDNPQKNSNAQLISEVHELNGNLYEIAGDAGSKLGTGGMYTKIEAANIAMNSGVHMVISNGQDDECIYDIAMGKVRGTHFIPKETRPHIKKRWMAFGTRLHGSILVDEGCAAALLKKGSSLLPAGIVAIQGNFFPGETVGIVYDNEEIARGLVNYSHEDLEQIKGLQSSEIAEVLNIKTTYDEVIHRDNLVILR